MLLLYIFSFKNFLWFKSFFWFIPIYCFNPTQTGGSYSWERFSGFSRPLSQIVDLDSQYQILWHFSYQIFTRRTHCALHLQKIVPIWPKSATLILCAESIWKCYYSNLRRINLVTVWSIKCRDFFPETSKIIFFLLRWYIIGLNPSRGSRTTEFHFEPPLNTLWKIALHLTYSWANVQQLFHYLVEHGIVCLSWLRDGGSLSEIASNVIPSWGGRQTLKR